MSETQPPEQEPSKYVTVFEQLKDTETCEEGDRFLTLGDELDDRYLHEDGEFIPYARPIAIIDAGVEIEDGELNEWCNSHAGKHVLKQYFPGITVDDPTLPDAEK